MKIVAFTLITLGMLQLLFIPFALVFAPNPNACGFACNLIGGIVFLAGGTGLARSSYTGPNLRYLRKRKKQDENTSHPLSFPCPQCRRVYSGSSHLVGRPFTCRSCKQTFTVPLESNAEAGHSRGDQ